MISKLHILTTVNEQTELLLTFIFCLENEGDINNYIYTKHPNNFCDERNRNLFQDMLVSNIHFKKKETC